MEVIVKGKNIEVTEELEQYAARKLGKLTKLSRRLQSARATFTQNASKKRDRAYRVEVVLEAGRKTMRAEEDEASFLSAVDSAVDKLKRQLKKLKTRQVDKPRELAGKTESAPAGRTPAADAGETAGPDVYLERFSVKPMSTAEAIMQIDVSGSDTLLFVNEQQVVNCLMRRPEGGYTLLVPEDETA